MSSNIVKNLSRSSSVGVFDWGIGEFVTTKVFVDLEDFHLCWSNFQTSSYYSQVSFQNFILMFWIKAPTLVHEMCFHNSYYSISSYKSYEIPVSIGFYALDV